MSGLRASSAAIGHGGARIVRDLDLTVEPGEIVALIGPNGAGKTTTLMGLAGVLPLMDGTVTWDGAAWAPRLHQRARERLSYVPEERSIFTKLTARQNLLLARGVDPGRALALFPELEKVMGRRGGLLSGGEQQMLALARALARPTKLLLVDELSLGLAPRMVTRLLRTIREAADGGMAVLLVEQHVHRVLAVADRAYVMSHGRVRFSGTADDVRARIDEVQASYLSSRNDRRLDVRQPPEVPSQGGGGE